METSGHSLILTITKSEANMNHYSMEKIAKEKYSARIKEGLHEQELKRHLRSKNPVTTKWRRAFVVATILFVIIRFTLLG
ncbi:MAG TPA: hypothetical protein VK851_01585 [Anaerolineales bacterium]|nr:hypothetical protein [Anaerolineales bacterium]